MSWPLSLDVQRPSILNIKNINLDIKYLKNRPYTELSGGERQLVMIAHILVQALEMILLDELTNHLDVYYQSYLMKKLRQLSRQNFTVITTCKIPI